MSGPCPPADGSAAALRRARRAWIAANHPDRGGDPEAFHAGLAAWAQLQHRAVGPQVRITVYRRRGLRAAARRAAHRLVGVRRARRRRQARVL
jgi:hypothetical protein